MKRKISVSLFSICEPNIIALIFTNLHIFTRTISFLHGSKLKKGYLALSHPGIRKICNTKVKFEKDYLLIGQIDINQNI